MLSNVFQTQKFEAYPQLVRELWVFHGQIDRTSKRRQQRHHNKKKTISSHFGVLFLQKQIRVQDKFVMNYLVHTSENIVCLSRLKKRKNKRHSWIALSERYQPCPQSQQVCLECLPYPHRSNMVPHDANRSGCSLQCLMHLQWGGGIPIDRRLGRVPRKRSTMDMKRRSREGSAAIPPDHSPHHGPFLNSFPQEPTKGCEAKKCRQHTFANDRTINSTARLHNALTWMMK